MSYTQNTKVNKPQVSVFRLDTLQTWLCSRCILLTHLPSGPGLRACPRPKLRIPATMVLPACKIIFNSDEPGGALVSTSKEWKQLISTDATSVVLRADGSLGFVMSKHVTQATGEVDIALSDSPAAPSWRRSTC